MKRHVFPVCFFHTTVHADIIRYVRVHVLCADKATMAGKKHNFPSELSGSTSGKISSSTVQYWLLVHICIQY